MVNETCIVVIHLSTLPLSILLLSTATQLWDGMGLDKRPSSVKDVYLAWFEY